MNRVIEVEWFIGVIFGIGIALIYISFVVDC